MTFQMRIITADATPLMVPAIEPLDRPRPFKLLKAVHRPKNVQGTEQHSIWKSAVANRLYLTRDTGHDVFGRVPDFSGKRGDVGEHGRRGPIGCDLPLLDGLKLWQAADAAAAIDRPELAAALHAIGWLPLAMTEAGWRALVFQFCDEVLVKNGMVADWAIHRLASDDGGWAIAPHVHFTITARAWRAGRNTGRRNFAWFGSERSIKAAQDAWRGLLEDAAQRFENQVPPVSR